MTKAAGAVGLVRDGAAELTLEIGDAPVEFFRFVETPGV
jgi:hypothetical protein